MSVIAVIPAAGVGARMGANRPKQYLPLFNTTILEYTVKQMLLTECIERVYIAVSESDDYFEALGLEHEHKVVRVAGGETRAQSVLNALDVARQQYSEHTLAVVHDAARPGITPQLLSHAIQVAECSSSKGVVVGIKATDTIKNVKGGVVTKTLNREQIYHALTPQIFPLGSLQTHLRKALASGVAITDESSAMEWAGITPVLVEGNATLRKITAAEDLIMVRALLALENKDKG